MMMIIKYSIFVLFLLTVIVVAQDSLIRMEWMKFKTTYKKFYLEADEETRFQNFKDNWFKAQELNNRNPKAQFGVTKFFDLSSSEFKSIYLRSNSTRVTQGPSFEKYLPSFDFSIAPASFDWRDKGVVTEPYNQGECGSCWAFSVTENIESMSAIAGRGLKKLSMQELVDCDRNDGACNGGDPPVAYKWIIQHGGIDAYTSYPYVGHQQACGAPNQPAAKISSWAWVTTTDNENVLGSFVQTKGPPSVCVDAELWQHYKGGVITPSSGCGTQLDHCVQLTGWQTMQGVKVWNVRNSWGADWGVGGYIFLEAGFNVCGIGLHSSSCIV